MRTKQRGCSSTSTWCCTCPSSATGSGCTRSSRPSRPTTSPMRTRMTRTRRLGSICSSAQTSSLLEANTARQRHGTTRPSSTGSRTTSSAGHTQTLRSSRTSPAETRPSLRATLRPRSASPTCPTPSAPTPMATTAISCSATGASPAPQPPARKGSRLIPRTRSAQPTCSSFRHALQAVQRKASRTSITSTSTFD
eukprot:Amastigsp_a4_175.p3 type:complete len:195 gc:universal Amastigsp_a4_175:782-1366(+)